MKINFTAMENKVRQNDVRQVARMLNGLKALSLEAQERFDQHEKIRAIDRRGYATMLKQLLDLPDVEEDVIIEGLSADGLSLEIKEKE